MKAKAGDWLVMKGVSVDTPDKRGLITDVRNDDGSPPYVVHWLDSDHVAMVFPGPDTVIVTAAEQHSAEEKANRRMSSRQDPTHHVASE